MEQSFRIGRVAGIEVGANWSVGVIFWLITWTLAEGVLPTESPGHAATTYWALATIGGVAFFGCLLAHELAHALVAQRSGMPVEGITLWLFGGVSRLGGDAPDPLTELRVALVGPGTSFGLGAAFGVVTWATGPFDDLVSSTAAWLSTVNIVLGVFNLVPAFPLDGGRVLQAVLWQRTGDRQRATLTAATAGRGFGYVLIAIGLLGATSGGGIGGVWLIFLGWFLLLAARAEGAAATVRSLLDGVRVREVMSPHPVCVSADLSVDDLLHDYLLRERHSTYPVLGMDGEPLGLVSLAGVRTVAADRRATTRVGSILMSIAEVPIVTPDDLIVDALARVGDAAGGRALVIGSGRVVGILTAADVQRALQLAELMNTGR
ncbi:MAG: site-2 protease family protein [Microthrixaceae bacterium]